MTQLFTQNRIAKFTILIALFFSINAMAAVSFSPVLFFSARMTGDQENPKVTTNARGVATISITPDKTTAVVDVTVTGLSGAITGAHIHDGKPGTNGGVVFPLNIVDGNKVYARIKLTPQTLAKLIMGDYYVNVHTAANGGGEIRGQIMLQTDWGFMSEINGTQAGNSTKGTGLAIYTLSQDLSSIRMDLVYTGVSDTPTSAHLHYGKPGNKGAAVVDLGALAGGFGLNSINVDIDLNDTNVVKNKMDFIDSFIHGNVYVNLHTKAFPNGEVRGQVMGTPGLAFNTVLNGTNEVKKTFSDAAGVAHFNLNPTMDTMSFEMIFANLDSKPKGMHLHTGIEGQNGAVIFDLAPYLTAGNIVKGVMPLDRKNKNYMTMINDWLSGKIYINIHDSVDPNGKIRGQLYRLAHEGYYINGNSGLVIPRMNKNNGAVCGGFVSINRNEKLAHYGIVMYNLSGTVNKASFNAGKPGKTGVDKLDMTSEIDNGSIDNFWNSYNKGFSSNTAKAFTNDSIYFQVLTTKFPNGELRANCTKANKLIRDDIFFPTYNGSVLFTAKMDGGQIVPSVTTTARGLAAIQLNKTLDTMWINVAADGLSDSMKSVHLHLGKPGSNGPVVLDLTQYIKDNHISIKISNNKILNKDSIAKLIKGDYYVNVHTKANPNGEIRGNFAAEKPIVFTADINANYLLPKPGSQAYGTAEFWLTPDNKNLGYAIAMQNLSPGNNISNIILKEMSANDTPGISVLSLTTLAKNNFVSGIIDISTKGQGFLDSLLTGRTFVQVYTTNKTNANGEAKGYLNKTRGLDLSSHLTASQQTEAVFLNSEGLATFNLSPKMDTLSFSVTASSISDTIREGHIHLGMPANSGKVIVDIKQSTSSKSPYRWVGKVSGKNLDSLKKYGLLAGQLYINLHTTGYPNGEIRGQVYPQFYDGYMFDLCASQQTTSNTSKASGLGVITLNRNRNVAMYKTLGTNLTSATSSAHIHNGALGKSGGVVFDFGASRNGNYAEGIWSDKDTISPFDTAMYSAMMHGMLYVNYHTSTNASGEVRGQIVNTPLCGMTVNIGIDEN
ncbi:MAG: CHRD domain-containing protein, partial [Bacteroidetes bacterium]|nr:CHRD domain-containing protein [Bacteroidota bacterium]